MLEKKHAAIFENFLKLSKRLKVSDLTVDEVPAVNEIVTFVYHLMNYCKAMPDAKIAAPMAPAAPVVIKEDKKAKKKK